MNRLKLGIVAESTGLPLRAAIEKASEFGCNGIQFDAVGDLAPERIGETGRREFRNLLRSFNLELAAINAPLRRGLDVIDDLQPRLDYIRKIMTLSYDLGAKKVVVPMPAIPANEEDSKANILRESLSNLGSFGDKTGCLLALEGGIDTGEKLKTYLSQFNRGSLTVCFDPANFLINGHDPLANLAALAGMVNYIHARDARVTRTSGNSAEVPLGAGDIEWMAYIATLESIGFAGYLTVERQTVQTRLDDLATGVKFLKRFIRPLEIQ